MNTPRSFVRTIVIAVTTILLSRSIPMSASLIGTAGNYGALGASTVTNKGSSVILGGVGVSAGSAVTGFNAVDGGPGLFTGTLDRANAAAALAQSQASSAYTTLAGLGVTSDLTGQDLGGMTLTPGVYFFASSAQLTGTLTLDALGDSNAQFVFQIGSTLTTAPDSIVTLTNLSSALECGPDNGLFWQVGSSAVLDTGTVFAGNILAFASVTLNTDATIDFGRAIALNGAVTLDSNRIDASDIDGGFCVMPPQITPVPEASTYGLVAASGLLTLILRRVRSGCLGSAKTDGRNLAG